MPPSRGTPGDGQSRQDGTHLQWQVQNFSATTRWGQFVPKRGKGEKAALVTLTESNFETEVGKGPMLVDFWATWCGPCKMIAPVLEELAPLYEGRMRIGKVDVDQNRTLAVKYGVMSIPTLILFKEGKSAERIVGYVPKKDLQSRLDRVL